MNIVICSFPNVSLKKLQILKYLISRKIDKFSVSENLVEKNIDIDEFCRSIYEILSNETTSEIYKSDLLDQLVSMYEESSSEDNSDLLGMELNELIKDILYLYNKFKIKDLSCLFISIIDDDSIVFACRKKL